MKKFCCTKFEFLYRGDKAMGLNIRIVKPSQAFVERGGLTHDKIFMITEGYSAELDLNVKKIVIEYCPFCGTQLKRFYKDDGYVQEELLT